MLIIKDIYNLQTYLKAYRDKGYSLGYVPTMGALHEGHGSLIEKSRNDNQKTIISIFINEKQFNDAQDFEAYPRNKGDDYNFCEKHNIDIIFEPSAEEIYPKEYQSIQNSHFKNILCDLYRPGHFDGVVTVLNRLFSIIQSDKVYFGEKDFQQLKIVENLTKKDFSNLKLIPVPTVRSKEGIALSSRNRKLSQKQMNDFISFQKKVIKFMTQLDSKIDLIEANKKADEFIKDYEKCDYFEFRNSANLSLEGNLRDSRLFYAIYKSSIRLIDNLEF
jgi:pantoate--beta-alanine ligase